MKEEEIKKIVRERYASIAKKGSSCCGPQPTDSPCSCQPPTAKAISKTIGYSDEEMGSVPEGANLGLGCGNPVALASLKEGETVLDLGAGAGFDVFLAANRVGKSGRVIGIDMTPEMVSQARANAEKGGYENVEFRLGEIENIPAADSSVDVIISNCVINLSPDKKGVFGEAFRVLKPGGRLMVSDIVLLRELPDFIKKSVTAYTGCVSGALPRNEYLEAIKGAGFREVKVLEETSFSIDCIANDPAAKEIINKLKVSKEAIEKAVASIKVRAVKPG
jgi:SAM-dependent methyltransferase